MRVSDTLEQKLLTPSEWRIYRLVAQHGPMTVPAIKRELARADRQLSVQALRTFIKRMQAKGYLEEAPGDRSRVPRYQSAVPLADALRVHTSSFLDQFALGEAQDLWLIRGLIEERLLGDELLKRIQLGRSRPLIRGTEITVDTVLESLGAGRSTEDILAEHSDLCREDVEAAVAFARLLVASAIPTSWA